MKHLSKLWMLLAAVFVFSACKKVGDLPFYQNGKAVTLSASTTTVAPAPVDSDKVALTLTWSNPQFATDSSNVKYVVQIDSAGRNFAKATSWTVTDGNSIGLTGKQLNAALLAYGFQFNKSYNVDVRVIASYANNNNQVISNTVTIKYTPYKIPPKIQLPPTDKLFLVGSATVGSWDNPVSEPRQVFSRLDETTYAGIFYLNGGEYLVLPVNGDWSHKYAIADKSLPGVIDGGSFGYDLNENFQGPATAGWYKITLDFQTGKYTLAPWTGNLPDNLFIVGDATPGGWNNPVPAPEQQFTRLNSSEFEITINLNGGNQYLLLPVNGDWSHKYAVNDNSLPGLANGGAFGYDLNSNFPAPAASGTYKINVNFAKGDQGVFSVTKL